jgi:L-threonylcarbamoyladenylate synthase
VRRAARAVRYGGVIAYPTEGVYGLGCDPECVAAVDRLLTLKGRSPHKGLILIGDTWERLRRFVQPMPAEMAQRVLPTWPGPVTWILPARWGVPRRLRGRCRTLAVRVTGHPVCAALCRAAGTALVSTSANRTGGAPAMNAAQVRRIFPSGLDYVLCGELGGSLTPTEIRDGRTGKVIRHGSMREENEDA